MISVKRSIVGIAALLTGVLVLSLRAQKQASPATSPNIINPDGMSDTSAADRSLKFNNFLASAWGAAGIGRSSSGIEVVRFDQNGIPQSTFTMPKSDKPVHVRGLALDDLGNLALLERTPDASNIVVLDPLNNVLKTIPFQGPIRRAVFAGGQLFALWGNDITRIADKTVVGHVPEKSLGPFDLVVLKNKKLIAVSGTAPNIYSVDLTSNEERSFTLDSPEIRSAMKSSVRMPNSVSLLFYSVAVDSAGMIYAGISPHPADRATVVQFDEYGVVHSVFNISLPLLEPVEHVELQGNSGTPRLVPRNMDVSAIAISGKRLFVYSQPHGKLAYYSLH